MQPQNLPPYNNRLGINCQRSKIPRFYKRLKQISLGFSWPHAQKLTLFKWPNLESQDENIIKWLIPSQNGNGNLFLLFNSERNQWTHDTKTTRLIWQNYLAIILYIESDFIQWIQWQLNHSSPGIFHCCTNTHTHTEVRLHWLVFLFQTRNKLNQCMCIMTQSLFGSALLFSVWKL